MNCKTFADTECRCCGKVEALTAERDQWKAEAQALAAGDKGWQRVARQYGEESDALKAALEGLAAAERRRRSWRPVIALRQRGLPPSP